MILVFLAGERDDTRRQCQSHSIPLDLNRDLEAALDGAIDLITTSAFLDLVSKDWLDRLATEIAARSIPFYAALTYDGRIDISPNDPADGSMSRRSTSTRPSDKGFGRRSGRRLPPMPSAPSSGWVRRTHRRSDWMIGPNDRDIQLEIFAAGRVRHARSARYRSPKRRRG
jgi:hypothetical protein